MDFEVLREWSYLLLAAITAICGLLRMAGCTSIDRDALYFLAASAVFLVLERIKKLNVGKDGVEAEFGEIKQELPAGE